MRRSRIAILGLFILGVATLGVLGLREPRHAVPVATRRDAMNPMHYSDVPQRNLGRLEALSGRVSAEEVPGMSRGGIAPQDLENAADLFVRFYETLQSARSVERFIVLGPDHFNRSKADVVVSRASFATPFGEVDSDLTFIERLLDETAIANEEGVFIGEHSIHAHTPLIAKYFPDAKIVPVLFRTGTANREATQFGEYLGTLLNEKTFVIASVDFSHYLPREQALAVDRYSADLLQAFDVGLAGKARADSPQSLTALVAAMTAVGADEFIELAVENSSTFTGQADDTTGFIIGFYTQTE